jgi:hypothetical protein
MRKSTVFISAVLTTFVLVMLYNVASAYRINKNVQQVTATTVSPIATQVPEPTDVPTPTESVLSPQEAAQIATQVIGNTSLLSAESSNINGLHAYKITFTNNDVVYVGLNGQILSVQVAPAVVQVTLPQSQPAKKHKGNHDDPHLNSSNAAPISFSGGGEHESEHGD